MIRFLKRYPLLCLIATLAACSEDPADRNGEDLPAGYSRIELFLSAERQPSTRAPWDDTNATDEEMMRYALVIMAKGNTVERIIPVNVQNNNTQWYERHSVGIIAMENGDYTFYSFANIPYTNGTSPEGKDMATINGLTFTVGSTLPEDLETSTWTADFNNYTLAGHPIPMTNKEEYPVNSNRSITLHLFRMLSKVNFEFTNKTGKEITVNKIELGEVTPNGTSIYFLPPKDGENIVNRFPTDFANSSLTVNDETTPIALPEQDTPDATAISKIAYLNESMSRHLTKQMPLTLSVKRGDIDSTETKYALMSLSGIPRNSYVVVPISITDYMLELKAFFHAPIGGYPPYTIENKKNDFYCTFSCGGDFILRPFIYKYEDHMNTEKWFELTDATRVDSHTLTVSDPDKIFSTPPYFSSGGEIFGTLNGEHGTASVRLTVYLKTDTPDVLQEYNRTLYIIV